MGMFSSLGSVIGSYWGPIGSTVGGGLGAFVDGFDAKEGQEDANAANIRQAELNRDFQERMSSTGYQRAVKDMAAAGLNPMLAYSQGPASTPSGSLSQVQNTTAIGNASAAQAMQTAQAFQTIQMNQASAEKMAAETQKIKSETIAHDINSARASAELARAQGEGKYSIASWEDRVLSTRYESAARSMAHRAMMATKEEPDLTGTGYGAQAEGLKADAHRKRGEGLKVHREADILKPEAKFADSLGDSDPYVRRALQLIQFIMRGGK